MDLALCSLASGSSGNCYLIKSEKTAILVDAGISKRQIVERLGVLGISENEISAVLLTHEHSDHTKGLRMLLKTKGVKLYTNRDTLCGINEDFDDDSICLINTGDKFAVGDILISSFHVSHDAADPMGFSFEHGSKRISIVTDTGVITDQAYAYMKQSDLLVLESNHDENILKMGSYPWFLKQRILSDKGHLSNDSAANAIAKLLNEGVCAPTQILLAHLSRENNFPQMALCTMQNVLEASGYEGKLPSVSVLSRDEQSELFFI